MRVWVAILGLACGAGFAAHAYRVDAALVFYGGVLGMAAAFGPLAVWAGYGRWSSARLSTSLTCCFVLLLLVALEGIGRVVRPADPEARVAPVYSFADARGNPEAFRRWWLRFLSEYHRVNHLYLTRDGLIPIANIPGASARFFDSQIRINSLGFRGSEISLDKGDDYRIVAFGGSTTFGVTIRESDRPWPALLQERIQTELDCDRPIEVVNGGVPGLNLPVNLMRLERQILPLDPDLVVSYHGYNGFRELVPTLGRVGHSPSVPPRPSRLLAQLESGVRSWLYRLRYRAATRERVSAFRSNLLETRYAADYRRLVSKLRGHGILPVLSTHNLALTPASPEEVARFYEGQFQDVRAIVLASQLHNRMVFAIAEAEGVPVIDATPGLEGAYADSYIDLVHHTQLGRERLARNIFEGLREILAAEPRLRCRPRSAAAGATQSNPS